MLAELDYPEYPVPVGVFRKVERPTYEDAVYKQVAQAKQLKGQGKLEKLFGEGETWEVK